MSKTKNGRLASLASNPEL